MVEKTDLRSLLVLHGPTLEASGILGFLREHFEVSLADDLDAALEAMRGRNFDAVLAETAYFLPLERGRVTQQAAVVLDTLGDGVCVVGPGGELVWANRRLRGFSAAVLERLRELCAKAYHEFAEAGARGDLRGRRFSLLPGDGSYFEVICSAIRDAQGVLRQVAAVVVDATAQRRQQVKLNAIERAGRELVCLDDDALAQRGASERLRVLQERIIRCSKDVLNFQHFAVLLLDRQTNRLDVVISEGLSGPDRKGELLAGPEGNGICGYVAATGRSYVCPDVGRDPRYLPGMDGARSSLTVPLRLHDRVVGVMNVESDRPAAFGEEDRQFAEIFANYVAMAMHILNLLVFERHSARTAVSGSIATELAGPLNDIVTEATQLVEDYIGQDDLRRRLGPIIDHAVEARRRIQQLARGEPPAVGVPPERLRPDPALAGKSVLIADDEEVIRQTIRDVLAGCGCVVDVACDGDEAREMLGRTRYDLVLSDIRMPGANGYEVFASAKAADPRTAVILMTAFGYDPHHSIVRACREGLTAVLSKPFKVLRLLEECRAAVCGPAR